MDTVLVTIQHMSCCVETCVYSPRMYKYTQLHINIYDCLETCRLDTRVIWRRQLQDTSAERVIAARHGSFCADWRLGVVVLPTLWQMMTGSSVGERSISPLMSTITLMDPVRNSNVSDDTMQIRTDNSKNAVLYWDVTIQNLLGTRKTWCITCWNEYTGEKVKII